MRAHCLYATPRNTRHYYSLPLLLIIHSPLIMLVSSTTTTSSTALVDTSGDLCDVSSLLKLFQDDGKLLNDELELDLLSENGIDTVHSHYSNKTIFHIVLTCVNMIYTSLTFCPTRQQAGACARFPCIRHQAACPATKRRRVSQSDEYIPSMQDLTLPSSASLLHPKMKFRNIFKTRLDTLVKKFQSSYASIMESKQQLDQQHHL